MLLEKKLSGLLVPEVIGQPIVEEQPPGSEGFPESFQKFIGFKREGYYIVQKNIHTDQAVFFFILHQKSIGICTDRSDGRRKPGQPVAIGQINDRLVQFYGSVVELPAKLIFQNNRYATQPQA